MTEWKKIKIGEKGYSYSGLSGKTINDFGSGKPFIPYMNIYQNERINPKQLEYVNVGANEHQNKVEKGDWFFTTSSETNEEVGLTSVLLDDIGEAYLNSFCFGFRLYNKEEYDMTFFSYLMRSLEVRKKITYFGQGSTRYNLSKTKMFERLTLTIPSSLTEQKRIASLLSKVDDVIENTKNIIDKLKKMKQGLLEDFFGKNDLEEIELQKGCLKITDGSHYSPQAVDEGYYMPSIKDMGDSYFDFSNCKKISYQDFCELKNNGCMPLIGDVLIAKDGSILKTCFCIKQELPIVILSSIAIIRPNPQILNSEYLKQYFKYERFVKMVIENYKSGTGVPRIVLNKFAQIPIKIPFKGDFPDVDKQIKMAVSLSKLDTRIESEQKTLEKYQKIKQGLLRDLLTPKAGDTIIDGDRKIIV